MDKHTRQRHITALIRSRPIASQGELVQALADQGIECAQASISRDLAEMGVVKVDGAYRVPHLEAGKSSLVDHMSVEKAGDNLIVIRTGPGHAAAAALAIDKARLTGIVGTVAGDDTIFIAVRGREDQNRLVRRIIALFQQ